ncbi:50S ribosomal protein L10 [Candidatus Woesearchaeota archaeon]|nr:50S ribosomal protein L10 [Candidatus Woesearchaeota archaeon]
MVSDLKKKLVDQLVADINNHAIVGLLDMENLPAQQLAKMRTTLRAKGVKMSMARKRILQIALEKSGKPGMKDLADRARGMPALLFSKDNPFALATLLAKNKSEAPAKAGQTSPKDVVVKAGATSFAPGPIISELAAVGIKTKVEGGKLAIINDTVVVKEGVVISQKVAETLKRLDIKPMEIGLNLVAACEAGFVFEAKYLQIDEAQYSRDFTQAATWALNLAVEIAYPAHGAVETLIGKAFKDAKAASIEAAFLTVETREEILALSERQANSVQHEAKLD